MNQLRRSIFSIHFCLTSRAKKSRFWCSHLERIQSQRFLLTVKILYFLTSIEIPLLNGFSGLGDGDYKPSADLLDLFNTVSTEFSTRESSSAVHVVKSEVFDTVLGISKNVPCCSSTCGLIALWDGASSSDRKDIIIKSEAVETELIHG